MLVDDAHLLDEPSAALPHQLAGTRRAFLVGTVRGGERLGAVLRSLWRHDRVVADQRPAAPPGRRHRAAAGGARRPDRPGRRAPAAPAQRRGTRCTLRELIRAGLESGSLCGADGVWRLHGGPARTAPLEELLADRLRGVGDDVRAAAEVVAFAEPIGLSTACTPSSAAPAWSR
ncbi:MAG TPA: hypothetical protein VGX25_10545 [Actinophytocola sp.]|uniref:hypothetical protein n=1 Tax=Actinophytocola sp. TaxID=1872138 RepID=UPI002DDCE8FB|nr:hypothetical protein [Actinophytocola sp.]HEV2779824.1 hypothetical protein [Actinophytocola sp.]